MLYPNKMIGLCGHPGHGKSTVQSILKTMGVEPIDDSIALRNLAMDRWNLTKHQVTAQEGKSQIIEAYGERMTVRKAMGLLGKEFEQENPNYWIDLAIDGLETTRPVSFGSVRMNQGLSIKKHGGVVVEVRNLWRAPSGHDFDQYNREIVDLVIDNSGDLENLRSLVELLITPYLES